MRFYYSGHITFTSSLTEEQVKSVEKSLGYLFGNYPKAPEFFWIDGNKTVDFHTEESGSVYSALYEMLLKWMQKDIRVEFSEIVYDGDSEGTLLFIPEEYRFSDLSMAAYHIRTATTDALINELKRRGIEVA